MTDPLAQFSASTQAWFRQTLGAPTLPQTEGWPAIQRGEHTLILAPTGSGKTLAAFLWGIDQLMRELAAAPDKPGAGGVRVLYVSPLKALNNDVQRNLRAPLDGIRAAAAQIGLPAPEVRVDVRTGDTPADARARMLTRPPHILITTPESLYLLLTSPRAREMFRTVRTVIVDEIHTLVGNKRGVHLALSLERLGRLASQPVQRIGLSATVQPLDEAARFLGGHTVAENSVRQRPVTIVNSRYPKELDLKVVTVVEDFRDLPADTIWPSLIPRVLAEVYRHHTTLIFANNRRLAERTADRLNAQLSAEQNEEIEPGSIDALAPHGIPRDRGMFAIGAQGPIQAHHGSMSKEARRQMQEDLKAGKLPALVGTSSLELGIDIGAIDLVIQLQSPKSVAQGLQRVGRSGHLVGQTSHGRIYATFREDLMEAAAIARGMLEQDVEPTWTPQNALDVLSQQLVAMVAVEDWRAADAFDLVRGAHGYRDLTRATYDSVLGMLAGAFHVDVPNVRAASGLRARLGWDRINDTLSALPGTRMLAVSNAGTIPDTGAYAAYLGDGKTRLGELDEEFVFETRVGDTFLLGSKVWRVTDIQNDRVLVADAPGATPRMPFWRGEYAYRPYELGARIGRFRREVAERIASQGTGDAVLNWLKHEYALDHWSARNLVEHVQRQLDASGALSSDTSLVLEAFENDVGDPFWVLHTPFGGRVNGAWAIALASAIGAVSGTSPEIQTNDDGILLHFSQAGPRPDPAIVRALTAADARERLLRDLPSSAVFGARFRMNAARALLLPRGKAGKRTPFWLQRMKARDLLALVGKLEDFPIVVETYRDCIRDVFDLPHLEEVLNRVQSGEIRVHVVESVTPSPIAAGLLYNFTAQYLYEWDAPKAERDLQALSLPRAALADVLRGTALSELLRPEAIAEVRERAEHRAAEHQPRSREELALMLRELGDLDDAEVQARAGGDAAAWIAELVAQGRLARVFVGGSRRWVPAELAAEYAGLAEPAAASAIVRRFLRHAGPVTAAAILARYPVTPVWLADELAARIASGELVRGALTSAQADEYCDIHLLDQIRRRTLTILRHAVQPVEPAAYAHFVTLWQHAHPSTRLSGPQGLAAALDQLRGVQIPGVLWERDVLAARMTGGIADLDRLPADSVPVWVASGRDARRAQVRLFQRGDGGLFLDPPEDPDLGSPARAVLGYLASEGASFDADVASGLGLARAEAQRALIELALAGLVTHDTFAMLRLAMGGLGSSAPERPPQSALEDELEARLAQRGPRALSHSRYRDARRRVGERMRAESALSAAGPAGRWSLVRRASIMGPPLPPEARAEKLVRVLLARYGVIARETLLHEALPLDWAALYVALQRMELRGEARRGYFVAGLSGAQFALPDAVERLRDADYARDGEVVLLNAADPANVLASPWLAGASFARLPTTHIALAGGRCVAVFEDSCTRITAAADADTDALHRACTAYVGHPGAPRRMAVHTWNGAAILGTTGEQILRELGFSRVPDGLERG